jgi:peptidoglycan/xylan/chitin deacetylase (PgdA/CDA1 family)
MATGENTTVHIARYAGDKDAAASFTFDDGHKSHAAIARLLDENGIKATFFVVANWVPAGRTNGPLAKLSWPELRALADAGHEIGNHSLTHMNLGSVTNTEVLAAEVDLAADMITKGTGRAPVSFAYPFCKSNPTVRERILRRHIVARGYHPLYEGDCPAAIARPWIDRVLADGSRHVYLSHGISTNALQAHLDDIAPLRDRLWIAPYGTVEAYCAAREQAQLSVTTHGARQCTFALRLPADAPPLLRTTALTVVIPAADVGSASQIAAEPTDRVVGTEARQDTILVTVLPSPGTITVRWSATTMTGER